MPSIAVRIDEKGHRIITVDMFGCNTTDDVMSHITKFAKNMALTPDELTAVENMADSITQGKVNRTSFYLTDGLVS